MVGERYQWQQSRTSELYLALHTGATGPRAEDKALIDWSQATVCLTLRIFREQAAEHERGGAPPRSDRSSSARNGESARPLRRLAMIYDGALDTRHSSKPAVRWPTLICRLLLAIRYAVRVRLAAAPRPSLAALLEPVLALRLPLVGQSPLENRQHRIFLHRALLLPLRESERPGCEETLLRHSLHVPPLGLGLDWSRQIVRPMVGRIGAARLALRAIYKLGLCRTTTLPPTGTRAYKSMMSALASRKHPAKTALPIVCG